MKLTKEEEITKQSYQKIAQKWSSTHTTPNFWVNEMNIFKKLLPKGKLLEIGCGGGRDAGELIEHSYDYVGTDISNNLLLEARKNNPNAKLINVSLYDINFNEKFDGFWCAAVLLHIPKRRINLALKSIKRNLKPGAIGFIAIKEGKGERVEVGHDGTDDKRLFSLWDKQDFAKVLIENGFIIMHQGYLLKNQTTKWLTYHVKLLN